MIPFQPGECDGEGEKEEEDENEDAYEAVAVIRVMMLCGLEERSPRHPHTHTHICAGIPSPMQNPHERTSTLTPSSLKGFGAYLYTICATFPRTLHGLVTL